MGQRARAHLRSISQNKVTACAINTSGEWLAFGSSTLGQLLVWEWQSESYILRQQGHAFPPTALAYSPEGQTIVTGGDDSRVKLWNVASGFCFVTFTEHSAPVTSVQFANSGQVVVSASKDGTVRAFDLLRYRNFRCVRRNIHPRTDSALDPFAISPSLCHLSPPLCRCPARTTLLFPRPPLPLPRPQPCRCPAPSLAISPPTHPFACCRPACHPFAAALTSARSDSL